MNSIFGVVLAVATISNVDVSVDSARKLVKAEYTLSGGPAIVTVDVLTNGVSAGAEVATTMWGDWGRKFEDGAHSITWAPSEQFADSVFSEGEVSFNLKAWEPATPPDYMVVDMVASNCLHYYESAAMIPYGGITGETNLVYKLIMRRIPAKNVVWRMGVDQAEATKIGGLSYFTNAIPHMVQLTEDYWCGIYEFTRGQWNRIHISTADNGQVDLALYQSTHEAGSPAEANNVSTSFYTTLRGSSGADWPNDAHAVAESSVIGKLRARTGIMFDLPTEAQWEYACHAGVGTSWNNGKKYLGVNNSGWDGWHKVGWREGNNGHNFYGHHVGGKEPNAWGLYDMHGNVCEFCLDWYASGEAYFNSFGGSQTNVVVDPQGPTTGTSRVCRGGSMASGPTGATSFYRAAQPTPSSAGYQCGFRVVCPILP